MLDGLRGVTDESTRTALAQQLLGRAGKELGTVLQTNAADFQAIQDRLARFGVVSEEATMNAERFNDEMDFISQVIRNNFTDALLIAIGETGNFDDILEDLVPLVRAVATAFVNTTKFLIEHAKTIGTLVTAYAAFRIATSTLVTSLVGLVTSLRAVSIGTGAAAASATAAGVAASGFGAALGVIARFLLPGAAIFTGLTLLVTLLTGGTSAFDGIIAKAKEWLGLAPELDTAAIDGLRQQEQLLKNQIALRQEDIKGIREGTQAHKEYANGTAKLQQELHAVQLEIREISQANRELTATSKTTAASVIADQQNVAAAIQETVKAQSRLNESFLAERRAVRADLETSFNDRVNLQSANLRRRAGNEIGGAFGATRGQGVSAVDIANNIERGVTRSTSTAAFRAACGIRDETVNKLIPAFTTQQTSYIDQLTGRLSSTLSTALGTGAQQANYTNVGTTLKNSLQTALVRGVSSGNFDNVGREVSSSLSTTLRNFAQQGIQRAFGGGTTGSLLGGLASRLFRFHDGGVVPGSRGQEVPAILEAGETIIPAGQSAGVPVTINLVGDVDRATLAAVRANIRDIAGMVSVQSSRGRF